MIIIVLRSAFYESFGSDIYNSTFISSSCVIIHNKINFVEKDKETRNNDSWVLSYHAILPKP